VSGIDPKLLLRLELDAYYADYMAALDEARYAEWPDFFVEDCLYRLMPRENHEQGLELCTMLCESRGMLRDRVGAVVDTSTYGPRSLRHLMSGMQVKSAENGAIATESNFLIVETLNDEPSRVFLAGRAYDRLVRVDGALKLKERLCVFDSNLILNSLIVPV
jgi:3-phenylpropionate/cinnamic acid dioxygenase small subunit